MSSLKSLKQRIETIKSTQKITKAMQMVAASKLKRAREAAEQCKDYATLMNTIVCDVVSSLNSNALDDRSLLFGAGTVKNILLVVVSSDRGLCGSYNTASLRFAERVMKDHERHGKSVKIFTIGSKSRDYMSRRYPDKVIRSEIGVTGKIVDYSVSSGFAAEVIEQFNNGDFDRCEMVYSNFKSVISQKPELKSLIPVEYEMATDQRSDEQKNKEKSDKIMGVQEIKAMGFTYDPSKTEILERLLPENIKVQFHHALIESNASEQASRMTAMDNATRNCGELIDNLRVVYNRTRQAQITKELIEIISGAEAV